MKQHLAAMAAVVLALTGCGDPQVEQAHVHAPEPVALAGEPDMSVYQLGSTWTDHHGETRTLADLAGRPQLIALVYTHCGYACPRIVQDMKRVEAAYPNIGFVLVSIDPERDTPGRLATFAQSSGLGERWTLLAGNDDALMELAAVLGIRYRRVSETEFVHSNVIVLLDETGVAAYRQEGLGKSGEMLSAVGTLRRQASR